MAVIAEVALRPNPEAHFEEVYASCQPRVFRTCLAILRNTDDAAEATQEVFSRALPLLTELREPHVWLQTVARNYCLDQLRRQKVRGIGTTLDEDTPDTRRDDPEREALLRDALRSAFEALSGRERRALARVLLMDDSLADIASMLGVSYGAAAQVVSRARRRAALAARAVIGASLGLLARLALPRDRERATRAAAQLLDSGHHVLLAAAVLLTVGGLARPAQAVSYPHSDGNRPLAPRVVAAAVGGEHTLAAPAPAAPRVALPSAPSVPTLPPGYRPGPIGLSNTQTPPGTHDGSHDSGPSPQTQPLYVAPSLYYSSTCAGAGLSAGPGSNPTLVDKSAVACTP